jgi:DNA-binding beta-propeller fold protein YncE
MFVGSRGARTAFVVGALLLFLVIGTTPLAAGGSSAQVPPPSGLPHSTVAPNSAAPAASIASQAIGGRLFDSTAGLPAGASNSVTGIAVDSSDGQVFAANEFAGTVTEFDESNGTVVAAVPVAVFAQGTFPAGLALDPVGHHVFVSVSTAYSGPRASGWLLVLNETGLSTVANISFASAPITPFEPTYLAFDPPTDQLFVENQSWGFLAIVNLSTDSVTGYLDCPIVDCAYHGYGLLDVPQYHTLVVPTCARQLWFVNTTNDSTRALVAGPPTSLMAWAAFDTANNSLWVENYTFNGPSGSFFRMNLSTLAIETNVPGAPPRGTDLVYDPVDNVLIATNVNGSLAIATFNATNATPIASYSQGTGSGHPFYTIALDPATGVAIAAGLGNGTTVAFHLPSLTIADTYPSFPTSQPAVATDPSLGAYFVAGNGPATVRAVSESTGAPLWTTPFPAGTPGSDFSAMAVDPEAGELFVADTGLHEIWVLDASNGAVTPEEFAVPPLVCAMLYDNSTGQLYLGGTAPSELMVLNVSGGPTISVPVPGSSPCSLALDPVTGDVLALSTTGTANLTELDPATLASDPTPTATWSEGSDGVALAVNSSGNAFLLEGFGATIADVNGSTGAPVGSFTLGGAQATSIASDAPDGLLFLGLGSTGTIDVAATSPGSVVGALSLADPAGCLSFDPTHGVLVAPVAGAGNVFTSTLVPVPGSPATLNAVAQNTSVRLAWTAPVQSGPDPVDGYVAVTRPIGNPGLGAQGGAVGVRQTVTGNVDVVPGLADGVAYEVQVFAESAAGVGTTAAAVTVIPAGVPYPPAALNVTASGPTRLEVAWSPPGHDDGSPITHYTISYYDPSTGGPAALLTVGNMTNATLSGLAPSTNYDVFVTATNAVGVGNASSHVGAETESLQTSAPGGAGTEVFWIALGLGIAVVAVVLVWQRYRRIPPRSNPPAPPEGSASPVEAP